MKETGTTKSLFKLGRLSQKRNSDLVLSMPVILLAI